MNVICRGNTNEKIVALTFDDGPDEKYTPIILEILKNNNVQAAFFCIGKKIESNHELVKRIFSEGHLIGNHSYTHHTWFDFFSIEKMKQELNRTDESVKKILNKKPKFFRPPYGVICPNLAHAAKNYFTLGWSVRSYDTMIKDKKKLLLRITKNINCGEIFLFHDTKKITADALQQFIDFLNEKKIKIVRIDTLLNLNAYE